MKPKFVLAHTVLVIVPMLTSPVVGGQVANAVPIASMVQAHTPPKGSAERQAILDAYRAEWTKDALTKEVIFVVNRLKVHDGWAWLDVNPRSSDGSQQFEQEQGLLRKEGEGWKVLERTSGFSAKYFKKLKGKYPAVPSDIFPPA